MTTPDLAVDTPTLTISYDHDAPPRIAVIVGSVRKDRMGGEVAQWAARRVESTGAHVDLIDLAAVELPDDALLEPGGGPRSPIADRIEQADAYLVVAPEYNHSYPAALKRAIDWHYTEWMVKPATVVSYGSQGGHRATEHLRGVFAELHVVTTRRSIALESPWLKLADDGSFAPDHATSAALDHALTELTWWAETLRTARHERPFPA